MNRLFKLQFLGPLALFAAVLSAELAARALQYDPSSELFWFFNLKMFGIFQRSYAALSYFIPIDGFQFFGIALPIFALACYGLTARSRLPFTVATHLSVAYAIFVVLCWKNGVPELDQATLGTIEVPSGIGLYVTATILGSCILSFAVTHLLYFLAVGKEIGALARVTSRFLRTLVQASASPSASS
jgi:hypothetical protein